MPFFKFVNDNNDVVRAVMYINSDDSQIDLITDNLKRWKDETKKDFLVARQSFLVRCFRL